MDWGEPLSLEEIPDDLGKKLVDSAPCLLGRDEAVYDVEFFHRVCGLCMEGPTPKQVTEVMVAPEVFESTWPPGEGPNKSRYLLSACKNLKHKNAYIKIYQRVYGDVPDNKAFSLTFLRACVYYFNFHGTGGKNPVNWASVAAGMVLDGQKHSTNNPLKLGPPALRQ